MAKILIIEDDADIAAIERDYLELGGYEVSVCTDGAAGLAAALEQPFDLLLLDLMLPGMDGFEICRTLRQESNTPVLMLTARDDEIDRVVGLEVGADDYLPKPFSMRELIARVKAILRRVRLIREEVGSATQEAKHPKILVFGNLEIDTNRREVRLDGNVLPCKPKEFELLTFMGEHKERVLTRKLILEKVWGWGFVGDSRTVDVHIRWLREKIEPVPENPRRIITIRGVGYRFEG